MLNLIPFKKVSLSFIIGSAILFTGCSTQPSVGVHGQMTSHTAQSHVNILFSQHDHSMLRGYRLYNPGRPHSRIPYGQYKKHLKRKHKVPRDFKYRRLPPHLERKLSPLPRGYIRFQIGNSFGIMNVNTRVIYDIIYPIH